ncbi:hypothetical protein WJX82_000756, partial [Trebouxia sp. C0006]
PDGELPAALQKVEPAMLELVCNEVVEQGGHVQWNDISGQDQAKRIVQELVVWLMLNPHLFKGARAPAKGLLLWKAATPTAVLLVGATNRPEELDEAARRRMPKQL